MTVKNKGPLWVLFGWLAMILLGVIRELFFVLIPIARDQGLSTLGIISTIGDVVLIGVTSYTLYLFIKSKFLFFRYFFVSAVLYVGIFLFNFTQNADSYDERTQGRMIGGLIVWPLACGIIYWRSKKSREAFRK